MELWQRPPLPGWFLIRWEGRWSACGTQRVAGPGRDAARALAPV